MLHQGERNLMEINESFEPLVKKVLEAENFGVWRKPVLLNWTKSSGCPKTNSAPSADRFNFSIPYAGETLQWTIIFNSCCPEMGPDFEFNDESFLSDPSCDTVMNHIPSLAKWTSLSTDSLLRVLEELVACYRIHQMDILSRHERQLHAEYKKLIDDGELTPSDVEVMIITHPNSMPETRFYISLNVDLSKLVGHRDNSSEDAALVIIIFNQPNLSRITPEIHLSTRVEETLNGIGAPVTNIPPFPRDRSISEYVPELKKYLADKIETASEIHEKRLKFVSTALTIYRRHIVEHDALFFKYMHLLYEHREFYSVVKFELPSQYPQKPPIVHVSSPYHLDVNDDPLMSRLSDFPYSPRWEPTRIIKEILSAISDSTLKRFMELPFDANNRRKS